MAVRSSKNNQEVRYGALPEDWGQLDILLGLGAYLLPVVANPNAAISKQSTIKHLGKTPSVYNSRREVVGIAYSAILLHASRARSQLLRLPK